MNLHWPSPFLLLRRMYQFSNENNLNSERFFSLHFQITDEVKSFARNGFFSSSWFIFIFREHEIAFSLEYKPWTMYVSLLSLFHSWFHRKWARVHDDAFWLLCKLITCIFIYVFLRTKLKIPITTRIKKCIRDWKTNKNI